MEGQTSNVGSIREKSSLERNYETVLFSHRWLTRQLYQILDAINTLSVQFLYENGEEECTSFGTNRNATTNCDDDDSSNKLLQIAKHLAFLLKFDEESLEYIDDCASRRDNEPTSLDTLSLGMDRLVSETLQLQARLAEVTEENSELKGQLDDVENLITIATDLKNENELLIADYNRFKVFNYFYYHMDIRILFSCCL